MIQPDIAMQIHEKYGAKKTTDGKLILKNPNSVDNSTPDLMILGQRLDMLNKAQAAQDGTMAKIYGLSSAFEIFRLDMAKLGYDVFGLIPLGLAVEPKILTVIK